jgi:adenylate kinase
MLNIALFGPPGAGKGTQSKMLLEKYNLTYIATGDILRQEISQGTELGKLAKDIIEKGGLVSDEIIVQIIENKIKSSSETNGFLFDGFPRTFVQAYILEGLLLKLNTSLNCVLSLEVPRTELILRMLERAKVSGRSDDTEEVIQVRLEEYESKTARVASYYRDRKIFFPISGVGRIDEIQEQLCSIIDTTLQERWMNIVLFGPPGGGKGTQAKLLAKKYNLVYISTGEILREEIKKGSETGKLAKPIMEKGDVVPDEIAIRIIEDKIKHNSKSKGFIFKGFPRNLVQAYILDGLLRRMDSTVNLVVNTQVPTLESIKRLTARNASDTRRSYDAGTDIIIHRLSEHDALAGPVLDYYQKQNKLVHIDGLGEMSDVNERLMQVIDDTIRKVW